MTVGDIFKVDGQAYDVIVPEKGITETTEILDSDKSTRAQNGTMFRDIIGAFRNYTVTVIAKSSARADFDNLYNTLASPVESHKITVPHGQSTITFQAYCTSVARSLKRASQLGYDWDEMEIKFVAKSKV